MTAQTVSRRHLLKVAGVATVGALLAACQPQIVKETVEVEKVLKETVEVQKVVKETVEVQKVLTATPGPAPKVQLRIGGWFDEGTQKTVDKQLKLFTEKFPNATVATVVIPYEPDKNVLMLASGTGPDIFWVNNDQTAPWASRKAIAPLDDFIAKDKIDVADFQDVGKVLYSYKGSTYAIAEYLGPLMLIVNPKHFEAAGVPLPPHDYQDPSWTMDALLEKAKALTKRTGDGPAEQYGLFVDRYVTRWIPFLWDMGGDLMDNWEAPTKVTFSSPETKATVQWLADLRLKHKVMATSAELEGFPWNTQFTTGKLSMLVEGGWMWPAFSMPEVLSKVPWQVYPMPRGPKGTFTRIAGDGYGMAAISKAPDMAWELLKHVTIGEGAKVFWDQALCKGIPALKSMAQDPNFGKWFSAGDKQSVVDLPKYCRGVPKHPNWYELQAKIDPGLDQVWTGDKPVESSVDEIQKAMQEVWDRVTKAG